jgi:hypothetical protein
MALLPSALFFANTCTSNLRRPNFPPPHGIFEGASNHLDSLENVTIVSFLHSTLLGGRVVFNLEG